MAVGPYGALLESVRGVKWPARRAVLGGAPGAHLARTRGVASEFAEYRPYRQGDDPRRLDWKLLARSDRAFIRLAPDRAVLGTLIIVDASASMNFPIESVGRVGASERFARTKWRAAKEIAVACTAAAHAGGDPVGLTIAARDGLVRLAPRTRRTVVAEIARTLDGLRRAARSHLVAGGEVLVVHVVSRAELQPPPGAVLAIDPEDAQLSRPLTPATRDTYRASFDAWRGDVARGWRDDGVAYHQVVDDEPIDVLVRRVVALPGGAGVRA
jgi:uncharacterized protein (DUF58 family)